VADDPRRWRQLTLWLHVLTSVGWMALALVLLVLLVLARTDGGATARSATAMAAHLDIALLAPLANASAATGLVLSSGTAWGLAHHRWVLAKSMITLVQLYMGIFVLSDVLDHAAETAAPTASLVAGTAAMAGAIAFQAWLSVAKPGGRTRWARDRRTGRPIRLPVAARWVFAVAVVTALADIAVGVTTRPLPVFSLLAVGLAVVVRHRRLREGVGPVRAARTAATAGRPRRPG
jgi:hypothetical protein